VAEKEKSKPVAQVVFFELLAAFGLVRLLQSAQAQDPWTIRFVYNACFFLAAYPFLAFWRAGGVPGLLRFILFPLGWALRLGLVVSTYLWIAYLFWFFQVAGVFNLLVGRPVAIGALFFLLYWSFFGPVLGTTGKGASLAALARLIAITGVVGAIGYLIGRGLDVTLAARQWPEDQRLWNSILVTLVFMLIGSWGGKVGGGKKGKDS
jgi:hypothetical protein